MNFYSMQYQSDFNLWNKGFIASGVKSRIPNPVPPDVKRRSTEFVSTQDFIVL